MEIISLVTILIGLLFLLIGYLVRSKQMVEIIAGYDPNKVKDEKGLAKWVGSNLLLMGLLGLLIGGLGFIFPQINTILVIGFGVVIVILAIRTAFGCKKYEKR